MRYAGDLANTIGSLQSVGVEADATLLQEVSGLADELSKALAVLDEQLGTHHDEPIEAVEAKCSRSAWTNSKVW